MTTRAEYRSRAAEVKRLAALGMSRRDIARAVRMSQSACDRLCQREGIRTHAPTGYKRGRIPTPQHTHPLVTELVARMNTEHATFNDIGQRAGIKRDTISGWTRHRMPKLDLFVAAANALGYEVVLREAGE